jgi:RHS repeat-associated protein
MAHVGVVLSDSSFAAASREHRSFLVLSRIARSIFLTLLLLPIVRATGWSQGDPAAGILPFSTRAEGTIDQVDLATSNILTRIPVRNKVGSIPFSYSLISNSHAWFAGTLGYSGFWNVNTGFSGTQEWPATHLTQWQDPQPYECKNFMDQLWYTEVVDSTGASHPLPAGTVTDQLGCLSLPKGIVTIDGSGYTVDFTSYHTANIYDRYGNEQSSAGVVSDPDGNTITSSYSAPIWTFTDTLSELALTWTIGSGGGGSPMLYQYTDAAGNTQTVEVNLSPYTQMTNFGCLQQIQPTGVNLPSSISVPSGGQYNIYYETTPGYSPNVTGRISKITFPSGGYVAYTYSGGLNGLSCSGVVPTLTRTVYDNFSNTTSTWTYVNTNSNSYDSHSNYTVTVTDPAQNQTVYNFAFGLQTEAQYYEGSATGTPLKTVVTCYNGNFSGCATWNPAIQPTQVTQTDVYTSFSGSSSNLVETNFDAYGNAVEVKQYDFGAAMPPTGNPISNTYTYYGASWNGTSCTASGNIRNTPCYSYTNNSSGTTVAKTQITYSGSHPTTTAKWTSGSSWLTSTATYNRSNGTVKTATDVNGTVSTPGYNKTGSGGCNSLLPTSFTSGGLTTSQVWDCNGGVVTSTTDANSQVTTINYEVNGVGDPLYRPLSVIDPLNYTTNSSYSITTVENAMNFNGTISTSDLLATVDGLGRQIFSQTRQGQGSSTFDSTQTAYGWGSTTGVCTTQPPYSTGTCRTQSVPYSGTAGQSAPGGTAKTTTQNDALGRPLTVTDGGGGTVSYAYVMNDVLLSVGPTQIFQKQLQYDGLGRLTSVCEVTSASGSGSCGQSSPATGFLTNYTYDALGNLLTVTQNAQPGAIGGQQSRTYTYDGLSRLLSETNPEWGPGTAYYTYDVACGSYPASAGDLTTRLDNAGNTTCFAYDGLHRLTDAGKSGPTCRHFRYDTNVTPPSGVTVLHTLSRMEEAYTDACSGSKITDEWFSYDSDGRMTDVYESTPHSGSPYYHSSASYWANGTTETLSGIPSVPTVYYGGGGSGLDGEGRVTEVTAASGTNPVNSVTYSATTTTTALAGSLTGVSFPSGDSDSFAYYPTTGRQKSYTFSVNGQTDTGTLTWNTNGSLGTLAIVDSITNSKDTQTCHYFYDDLGRLGGQDSNGYSVDCGSTVWQQSFTFDPFGNIKKSGSASFLPTYSETTNQFTAIPGVTVRYDNNGNLLTDNLNTYTWDQNFGNPASANGITLIYDAQGRMVEQQNGSAYTEVLYSPVGKTALMNGQALTKAFVPLPGGETAIYNSTSLAYYRHSDWLGSSRLTSTSTAPTTAYSISAYAPFGEQYAVSGTSDPSFTGQNSDTVSSLYDFTYRENSPSQGRWISPDPSGLSAVDPSNPQTWNRYAYVLNNPLSNIDPLGLDCVRLNDDGSTTTYTDDQDNCEGDNGYYFDGTVTNTFVDANNNVLANVNGQFGCSGDSGCSMYNNLTSITVNGGTPGQVGTFTSGLNGYIPYSLFSPSMFKSGGPPPIAQIGKPHLSRSQAKARCFVDAQLDNNGFDSEGFHAPDPGRALFPNQGTNVFNNTTQVLPGSSQPSVSVNPQGAESGEGAESVAVFGYFAAIGESYTRCMEAYDALVSSGSIGQ